MGGNGEAHPDAMVRRDPGNRLSYKFQRLREQIRRSVLNGEFDGRLPGERELGRKYKANAKTINKALCDLSSEGLLVRHIGRGTYIAEGGGEPAYHRGRRRFMSMLPAESEDSSPYRRILFNHFRDRLAHLGHGLDTTTIPSDAVRLDIPLKAWSAAIRSTTDGLIAYPRDPLSGGEGRLGDECVEEAFRRHVPMISLGGFSNAAKTDAVVPDYVAAGFRIAEHLALLGCAEIAVLLAEGSGREAEQVVNGCRTAAIRYRRPVFKTAIRATESPQVTDDQLIAKAAGLMGPDKSGSSAAMGLICIGGVLLRALMRNQSLHGENLMLGAVTACVLEPGDTAAQEAGLTAYEVDPRRIGAWGADLVAAAKPGRTPVEIVIPGELKIRGTAARRAAVLGVGEVGRESGGARATEAGGAEVAI
jgi:DNA-binding LacI/PurR family transcriptional regulator